MFALLLVGLVGTASAASLRSGCIEVNTAKGWVVEMEKLFMMNSDTSLDVCANSDLMIRIDQLGKNDAYPVGLQGNGNFWTWVADSITMDKYYEFAKAAVDSSNGDYDAARKLLTKNIMVWVGWDNPEPDANSQYILTVFSRKAADSVGPYPVFSPTWDNLFNYYESGFQPCKGTNCTMPPISIKFSDSTKSALKQSTATQVTGCTVDLKCRSNDHCSTEFCNMNSALIAIRNDPNTDVVDAARYYANTDQLAQTPAQARAFFNVVLGATYLFSGTGEAFNGAQYTGNEYIVRGDVPVDTTLQGSRFKIFPAPF